MVKRTQSTGTSGVVFPGLTAKTGMRYGECGPTFLISNRSTERRLTNLILRTGRPEEHCACPTCQVEGVFVP